MAGTETITVVFTDLVGSTELSSRLAPDAADELRQVHFGLLRKAIEVAGGREVKNLGDGLMAVLSSAKAGLDAAVAMQVGIEGHNRRADVPISVRIGLSQGDATEEEGDYFGEPVIEAARLCAVAQGGQILCTDTLKVMARRSGHRFVTDRELELKGLPEPVVAWEVAWSAPEAPGTAKVPLPARLAHRPTVSFIGRSHEREVLAGAFKEALGGEGRRLVLVAGEAGIGKSTLVSEAARQGHTQGAVVLCGHFDEDLGVPYQPFVEVVGHLATSDRETLGGLGKEHLSALGRVVPEVRQLETPTEASGDPEAERWLMYSAVKALLERAADPNGLVLLLEDLHWADRPTLTLLRHLVASLKGPVLLLATYRDAGLSSTHPLTETLASLAREAGVGKLSLGGLDDTEVVSFVEAAAGHDLDEPGVGLAHALYRETDGNPFFVGEVLRHLVESRAIVQMDSGRWVPDKDLEEMGLPESLRQVIGARVGRLGEETAKVLRAASVIGQEFDLELLAAVVEKDEEAVLDALEVAAQSALTSEVSTSIGRFQFVHALIQHTLYEDLGPTRQARLHSKVAECLETVCGTEPGERVGELARHHLAATRPADVERTAALAQMAGEAAMAALAPDEALRWFNQALEVLGRAPEAEAGRARLLCGLGRAQYQLGDPAFRQTLLDAGHLAQAVGDRHALVEAALANSRGYTATAGPFDTERVDMLEAALGVLGQSDAVTRARLLVRLALQRTHDYAGRRALADEALALARRSGDKAALLDVLLCRVDPLSVPEAFEELLGEAKEAEALAAELGGVLPRYSAARGHILAAVPAGAFAEVGGCLEVMAEAAAQTGFPTYRWGVTLNRSMWVLTLGDATRAEALATEALELAQQTGQPDAMVAYGGQLVAIRWHQGRLGEIADLLAGIAADNPAIRTFQAGLGRAYLESGRTKEARAVLDGEARRNFDHPNDPFLLTYLCLCAEAASGLEDRAAAAVLYERLSPWPRFVGWSGVLHYGVVAHYLGALATALERFKEAEHHLTYALSAHQAIPAPFFVARTELEWGKLLLARGGPGDLERAREHLDAAAELSRRHGCGMVEARAKAMLGDR